MTKHLFLTGFMGAGKTTVGQGLAAVLKVPFVDLDLLISEVAGKTIPEIFDESGEFFFRDLESECLHKLSRIAPAVVATGGGIVGRADNRQFMHDTGLVVYLAAEWDTLKQRIGDTTGRPLARAEDGWSATKALWEQRRPLYEQAHITINTDRRALADIIAEIRTYAENSM